MLHQLMGYYAQTGVRADKAMESLLPETLAN